MVISDSHFTCQSWKYKNLNLYLNAYKLQWVGNAFFFIDAVLQFINRGEDSLPLTQGLWNINETWSSFTSSKVSKYILCVPGVHLIYCALNHSQGEAADSLYTCESIDLVLTNNQWSCSLLIQFCRSELKSWKISNILHLRNNPMHVFWEVNPISTF